MHDLNAEYHCQADKYIYALSFPSMLTDFVFGKGILGIENMGLEYLS